jgi:hypothetical protein
VGTASESGGVDSAGRVEAVKDDDLLRMWTSGAGRHYDVPVVETLRTIARAAAAEERRSILHETGSTVISACAALVRLSAPDDVDEHYVPRAAVVDIAMGLKRDMDALRSRSVAGEQGRGGGNG